jgi:hypothetical protein
MQFPIHKHGVTLGHSTSTRSRYWPRVGTRVGIPGRRFLRRLDWSPTRPLLAYERRRPYTCGLCGQRMHNGNDCRCEE